MLEGTLSREQYQQKNEEMNKKISQLKIELNNYSTLEDKQKKLESKLASIREC